MTDEQRTRSRWIGEYRCGYLAGGALGTFADARGESAGGLTVLSNGAILYSTTFLDGTARVCALTSMGVPDASFGTSGCWMASEGPSQVNALVDGPDDVALAGGGWNDAAHNLEHILVVAIPPVTATAPNFPEAVYPNNACFAAGAAADQSEIAMAGACASVAAVALGDASGPDPSFGVIADDVDALHSSSFNAVTTDSSGRILAGGVGAEFDANQVGLVVRYTASGGHDGTFGTSGVAHVPGGVSGPGSLVVHAILTEPDGRIVVGGLDDNGGKLYRLWP